MDKPTLTPSDFAAFEQLLRKVVKEELNSEDKDGLKHTLGSELEIFKQNVVSELTKVIYDALEHINERFNRLEERM